jgi:succinyl-diaminopimelate desuccinylase
VVPERDLLGQIDASTPDLIELCRRLVAAPSVSPPGDTREVAEVVRAELESGGIEAEITHRDPRMPSVLASIESAIPGHHLIMNVHLDTMPAGDESRWSVDPWTLTEREGRLYGLGMGNMKGAIAAMALAMRLLARNRDRWAGRVTFAAVADEVMFGDQGAAWLLEARQELTGDALVCGEGPGWMRLAIAEKGVAWYEVTAEGPSGHASSARAESSAIAKLAAVATQLDGLSGRRGSIPTELGGLVEAPDDPGVLLTFNVGTFEGGTVVSQLPTEARATIDARVPPGVSLAEVDVLVRDACDLEGVRWTRVKGWDANWTDPETPIARAIARAVRAVRGTPPRLAVRLPASDASRWRARGVPAICFGPQPTFSAGTDDYAERDDVIDCAKIYTLAALDFLRPATG